MSESSSGDDDAPVVAPVARSRRAGVRRGEQAAVSSSSEESESDLSLSKLRRSLQVRFCATGFRYR